MTGQLEVGVVVLTMGSRREKLRKALASLSRQVGVHLDVVVAVNGDTAVEAPEGMRVLLNGSNLGIPAGRNRGAELVEGEFIFFLDDDSWLLSNTFLADAAAILRTDDSLGMIQPRIVDPDRRGEEPTRWIPRLRKGQPERSSEAFSVLETAVLLRRDTFDATGGWPDEFFYGHEGIELAWRVWDAGRRVEYRGDLEVAHPVVDPYRHRERHYFSARNRVWLARRCLRWPFSWAYVTTWTLHHLVRALPENAGRVWWEGWWDGWSEGPFSAGRRRKLRWATHLKMALHGRPPVV